MSELPPNWALARVGDLVDLGPKNDCPDDTEVGFVPLQRLGVDYRSCHTFEPKPWSAVKKGYTHFADGDVLLARITPSFENGKAGIVQSLPNGIGAGSTEYFVCRPLKGALLPEYLLAHFKTPQFLRDGEQVMSGAVGQQRVPKQYVLDSKLRLAPFNEQKRIADKLDAVLTRVDACRERFDRVSAILKRFRQAVLTAATSGKLTEEWRREREASWIPHKLGNIARFIDYRGKTPTKTESGIPLITAKNIRPGYVAMEPREYISDDAYTGWMTRGIPRIGDVLITTEAPLGNVAIVDWEFKFALAQRVICLQFQNDISVGKFAAIALQAPTFQFILGEQSTGTTVAGIKASRLKELEIVLPAIDEQHEIVRRVEALFAYADRLEARYTAARAQVECLTPALLAKAFRGELVPQDPNDEPASVLLERIRAARAVAGANPPRKVRTERKPMTTKLTTDALKEIIRGLPTDRFTFNDLRGQVSADYETLKDVVFALLSEVPASVKQVFDTEAQTMQLVRVK